MKQSNFIRVIGVSIITTSHGDQVIKRNHYINVAHIIRVSERKDEHVDILLMNDTNLLVEGSWQGIIDTIEDEEA